MIIIPANTLASGGYAVDNSLRFNDGSSDYLNKTYGSASNRKTWTFSAWFKLSSGGGNTIFSSYTDGNNWTDFYFSGTNKFEFVSYASAYLINFTSSQVFRDYSAWTHIVLAFDTTQATASNRIKLYVNGSQVTALDNSTYPTQNSDHKINSTDPHTLGLSQTNTAISYDGYMAEVCFIDGSQLDPTSFGEFDEDSGIWKPIDVSGLTFGTNGFYLDFEDSGALGDDVSGNGNDFTVNNLTATDQSTDTCTNNFAVLNPLIYGTNYTWSEGNLQFSQPSVNWDTVYSSIGVTKGKWYMEFKGKAGSYYDIGVTDVIDPTNNISVNSGCVAYKSNGEFARAGGVGGGLPSAITSPASNTYTADDIMSIAIDVDNEAVYFAKNGAWEVSSDPTSGASKTGAVTLPNSNSTYFFAFASYGAPGTSQVNFGGGSVDAISSGNTDGDGYGNFEYAVPSGYYSLCTKNLAEYG